MLILTMKRTFPEQVDGVVACWVYSVVAYETRRLQMLLDMLQRGQWRNVVLESES